MRVDPIPPYGNDPGKPGFGTIVAVIDDGAHLFPAASARPAAADVDAPYFFRHVLKPRAPQVVSLLRPDLDAAMMATELMALDRSITPILHPAPLTVPSGSRRYSFYSPEMNLIAETALTASGAPPIAYEYVWFNGQPVAQLDATGATHWTFTDHLGTPLVLTSTDQSVYWRAEYEPFGAVFALRSGDVHQPLRLPGQEAEQLNLGANGVTEREYNVFRWYRGGWGRYTQPDPISLAGGMNLYRYAGDDPVAYADPFGLVTWTQNATNPFVSVRCTCGCDNGSYRAKVSLFMSMNVWARNDDPQASLSQILYEEEKHVRVYKVRFKWAIQRGERLEAREFPNKPDCDAACKQYYKATYDDFNDNWVHQYNPHPN